MNNRFSPGAGLVSDDHYRLVVEHANEAIFVIQDGHIRYANPKTLEMSGYSREELCAVPFVQRIHEADREMVMDRHLRRLRGETFDHVYPLRVIQKEGNVIWIEINVVMIQWQGHPATLNIANDITRRKQAEEALKASEERYRALFFAAPLSIVCYDRNATIRDCNEHFSQLFGAPVDRLIGSRMEDIGDERTIPCMMEVFEGREGTYEGSYRSPSANGRLWVILRTAPLRDAAGQIVGGTGIIQDLTDYHEACEELTIKSHHLEQSNMALRAFIRNREEEKEKLQSDVMANVRELVLPYVKRLKTSRSSSEKAVCTDVIESNLHRIVSPFLRNVSHAQLNLTPREIQIANLIRDGKTSKEISELLNVSVKSVESYRIRIRRKLGIANSRANLRSQLLART